MSELHSERHDRKLQLTIRVKLVDLDHVGPKAKRLSASQTAEQQSWRTNIASVANVLSGRPVATETESLDRKAAGEICMRSGARVASGDFEGHIEQCAMCSNRVELQLDFMDTLELAVYQRQAEPNSKKIGGAMLVSAPELNFAICGELER